MKKVNFFKSSMIAMAAVAAVGMGLSFSSCCGSKNANSCSACACPQDSCACDAAAGKTCLNSNQNMKAPFQKKYTNADFYDAQGNFKQDVAKQAFSEMFVHYDVPFTPLMEKDIWFTDFGLGDFENTGMGGIFWVNDSTNGYFAHAIYLLPGQMIPEHKHVKTAFPAKMESWMVDKGWCYNFSEIGEATEGAEALVSASQKATTVSKHYVVQKPGEIVHLSSAGPETWHCLIAGPEGAIVTEWANYHDGAGLRFTNTKAAL